MIMSFVQYLLMVPSYVQSVSPSLVATRRTVLTSRRRVMGDEGRPQGEHGPGGCQEVRGQGKEVKVTVPMEAQEIDAAYEDPIRVLTSKPPEPEAKAYPATQMGHYYFHFRTKCVTALHVELVAH